MSSDELQILDYLKQYPDTFVSVVEICKRAGGRKRFTREQEWARPVLRRLEVDGLVDSNEYGQYKLRDGVNTRANPSAANLRYERCCKAISTHVISMSSDDDNKPFSTLIREAISTEYAGDTSIFTKQHK